MLHAKKESPDSYLLSSVQKKKGKKKDQANTNKEKIKTITMNLITWLLKWTFLSLIFQKDGSLDYMCQLYQKFL